MEFLSELHPFVVHFPIALFLFYALVETWNAISKKNVFGNTADILIIFVVIASVIAALTGNQAEAILANSPTVIDKAAEELIERHETFATISIWYFFLILVLRFYFVIKKKFNGKITYLFALLALVGCILILITGKLGGDLVYDFGIGTSLVK